MKTLLCIAVVALFASSVAKGVVEADWATKYHRTAITNVHVLDTLGVSASYYGVYFWNASTGALLDSLTFSDGHVQGAWISDSGKSVLILTYDDAYHGCALHWYGWPALDKQDSIVKFNTYEGPASSNGTVNAAISQSNTYLSIIYYLELNYGQVTNTSNSIVHVDLQKRAFVALPLYAGTYYGRMPARYEARDSVITNYSQLEDYRQQHGSEFPDIPGNGNRSVSPTRSFIYDGVNLYDNVRQSFIQRVSGDDWYVVAYGPDDAHVVGVRRTVGSDHAQRYELCVVSIVPDSVLQVIDTSVNVGDRFWVDSDHSHVYNLGDRGVLRRWPLAKIAMGAVYCSLAIPDTVFSDSLYIIGALLVPHVDPQSVVVDPGDGRMPTTSTHWSWRDPGAYSIRIGIVNVDTAWIYTRSIVVLPNQKSYAARYFLELGRSQVVSIDISDPSLILLETASGLTSVLYPELQSQLIRQFNLQSIGTSWSDNSTIRKFDFYGTESRPKPSSSEVLWTNYLIGSNVEMKTLGRINTDTAIASISTYTYPVRTAFLGKLFSNRPKNETWIMFAWYPTGTIYASGGGVYSYSGDSIVDHRFSRPVYKYSYMDYAGNYGNACVSADGSLLTLLFYNYYVGNAITKFMLVDLLRDSIKSIIPGFYTSDMQSVGKYSVVTDGHWLSLEPFNVSSTHPFTGPFAEDAVPDHAIAWKDGWFYSFHPNGRIHDSVQADTMRPTVIRVFKDGRIIAGYASGLVAIYGNARRDLTDVQEVSGLHANAFTCWPNPTSDVLHCQLRADMPLPATFEIFDMQGRLCGTTSLSTHDADVYLPSMMNMEPIGMFVVRVRSGAIVQHHSVVVVK